MSKTSKLKRPAPVRVQPVVLPHVLLHEGGEWLGAARTWLQWNTRNGDSVTWGSHDEIKPTLTVKMVEELAAHAAAAAINADRRVRQNSYST